MPSIGPFIGSQYPETDDGVKPTVPPLGVEPGAFGERAADSTTIFTRASTDGRHSTWTHPSGAWVAVPDSHRTISPGVVRKINDALRESEGK